MPCTCAVCGAAGPAVCGVCARRVVAVGRFFGPPGLDSCRAAFAYEGAGRELVLALKYRGFRAVVRPVARAMAATLPPGQFDVVTWVPTSARRRRQRGYDQARLLARALAREMGLPCRNLLRRRPGAPQTGKSRSQRGVGPVLVARRRVSGRVLLVDDVLTTGATLAAASIAARRAGAQAVHGVTAAATPLKVHRTPAEELEDASPSTEWGPHRCR
jgi:predicted amidophosphoribosyltransferase